MSKQTPMISVFMTDYETLTIKSNVMNELETDRRKVAGKVGCKARDLYIDGMRKISEVAYMLNVDIHDILPIQADK